MPNVPGTSIPYSFTLTTASGTVYVCEEADSHLHPQEVWGRNQCHASRYWRFSPYASRVALFGLILGGAYSGSSGTGVKLPFAHPANPYLSAYQVEDVEWIGGNGTAQLLQGGLPMAVATSFGSIRIDYKPMFFDSTATTVELGLSEKTGHIEIMSAPSGTLQWQLPGTLFDPADTDIGAPTFELCLTDFVIPIMSQPLPLSSNVTQCYGALNSVTFCGCPIGSMQLQFVEQKYRFAPYAIDSANQLGQWQYDYYCHYQSRQVNGAFKDWNLYPYPSPQGSTNTIGWYPIIMQNAGITSGGVVVGNTNVTYSVTAMNGMNTFTPYTYSATGSTTCLFPYCDFGLLFGTTEDPTINLTYNTNPNSK